MNKNVKQRIIKTLFILIMLLGVLICITPYTINHYITPHTIEKANENINQIEGEKIKENQKRINEKLKYINAANYKYSSKYDENISYDPESIKSISSIPLNSSIDSSYMIGKLYVPNVGLNIAVLEGLTNNNLNVASGTMKPHQKMGEGNFAIAGHRMIEDNLLFSPVSRININDKIYLSDKVDVYEYITIKHFIVSKERGNVIDDVPNERLITLVTCSDIQGTSRLIVQGKFIKKYSVDKAPENIKTLILN